MRSGDWTTLMVRGTVGGGSGGKGGSLETGKGMGRMEVSELHLGNFGTRIGVTQRGGEGEGTDV